MCIICVYIQFACLHSLKQKKNEISLDYIVLI